jgi:hypothetical protein
LDLFELISQGFELIFVIIWSKIMEPIERLYFLYTCLYDFLSFVVVTRPTGEERLQLCPIHTPQTAVVPVQDLYHHPSGYPICSVCLSSKNSTELTQPIRNEGRTPPALVAPFVSDLSSISRFASVYCNILGLVRVMGVPARWVRS